MKNPDSSQEERDFLDDFAHELKTPLTSIIASWSLLSEEIDAGQNGPLARLVQNIGRSAKYMRIKIDELLDLAKMRIKNLDLQKETVDIKAALREVVDQFSSIIQGKRQQIDLNMPTSLPAIQADKKRIEQILFNLLSNASRFTPGGSSITVTASQDTGSLVIEVKDGGPPIEPEQIAKLLGPRYYNEAGKQRLAGVGPGFALTRHLVDLHNGKVWIESKKDQGNVFAFSLPLA